MRTIELTINDSNLAGWDALALVEMPAIQEDFYAFNKQEFADTYSDYPEGAVNAAKRGIELNEENNMKCATQVGKVRAQQLANGESLSIDTIKRMRAFLIRQKDNYELALKRKDYNACGYISYLLWGGEPALPWAEKKLRQSGYEFSEEETDQLLDEILIEDIICVEFGDEIVESHGVAKTEESTLIPNKFAQEMAQKMRVMGPIMTPDKLIPRVTEDGEPYQVYFSAKTIEKIAYKAMAENKIHKVNIEHDKNTPVEDAFMIETWLVEDEKKDKSLLYGFEPVKGQWFAIYQLGKETWDSYVKTGLVKGYSLEGYFIENLIK